MTSAPATTPMNNAIITALKSVKETQWVGNLTFDRVDQASRSIMLNTLNSGSYNPRPFRIAGVTGWFLAHQGGQICFEYRMIVQNDYSILIEELSMQAFNEVEQKIVNQLRNTQS